MKELEKCRLPEIVVFAGPNGSGKSTFTELLRPINMDYVNADDIQKALNCGIEEAANVAENRREKLLSEFKEFCFETVLSTDRNLKLLKKAKEKGYFIRCYYILTVDPAINIYRVKSRVAQGGHDVPEEKIVSRYEKALNLLKEIVEISDVCHIYDNSTAQPFRFFKKRKEQYFYDECEDWLYADISLLTGKNDLIRANLNSED